MILANDIAIAVTRDADRVEILDIHGFKDLFNELVGVDVLDTRDVHSREGLL